MSIHPSTKVSIGCTAAIIIFIAVLYAAPELLRKKNFQFQSSTDTKQESQQINVESEFDVFFFPQNTTTRQLKSKRLKLSTILQDRSSILINFWATWCPPCIEELPSLEYLARSLATHSETRKLPLLITISVDETKEEIAELVKTLDFKPTFAILHDPSGVFSRSLGTTKFPETYWVDSQGAVLHKWIGPQNWLSESIMRTLGIKRPTAP